jgi:hypothetical protein
LKIKLAKQLAAEIKNWEAVFLDFYQASHCGINFYKRKISKNYWQVTVLDDITSCTFKMYQKER